MKNTLIGILLIVMLILCIGCQHADMDSLGGEDGNTENTEQKAENLENPSDYESIAPPQENVTIAIETETNEITNQPVISADPPRSIEVRSYEQLQEMKEMIACEDEAVVKQYLTGLYGGLVQSKDDLIAFVSLIEKIPYPSIIDGDITWISYMEGESVDTNCPYQKLDIMCESEDGDWVWLEYLLSEHDVEGKILKETTDKEEVSLITSPIISQDGKIMFHIETRVKHPALPGDYIQWVANMEGIFVRVNYYTADGSKIDSSILLNNVEISGIPADE